MVKDKEELFAQGDCSMERSCCGGIQEDTSSNLIVQRDCPL